MARFLASTGDTQPAICFAKQPRGYLTRDVGLRLDVVAPGYIQLTNPSWSGERRTAVVYSGRLVFANTWFMWLDGDNIIATYLSNNS